MFIIKLDLNICLTEDNLHNFIKLEDQYVAKESTALYFSDI